MYFIHIGSKEEIDDYGDDNDNDELKDLEEDGEEEEEDIKTREINSITIDAISTAFIIMDC